jgi:hypothetical protein
MRFKKWLEKYMPFGSQDKVLKKAGLCTNQVCRWKKGVKPNTSSIIYLSKALSLMYDYDYKTIVLQGMKAAAQDEIWKNFLKNTTTEK